MVLRELRDVVEAAEERPVKVIIETCLLTRDEKILACQLIVEAGAQFVKTSTGFNRGGATIEDVKLLRETVGPKIRSQSRRRYPRHSNCVGDDRSRRHAVGHLERRGDCPRAQGWRQLLSCLNISHADRFATWEPRARHLETSPQPTLQPVTVRPVRPAGSLGVRSGGKPGNPACRG